MDVSPNFDFKRRCDETGVKIQGVLYYACYEIAEGETFEIHLDNKAFFEPTQFDITP